jgi:hypothetical protein
MLVCLIWVLMLKSPRFIITRSWIDIPGGVYIVEISRPPPRFSWASLWRLYLYLSAHLRPLTLIRDLQNMYLCPYQTQKQKENIWLSDNLTPPICARTMAYSLHGISHLSIRRNHLTAGSPLTKQIYTLMYIIWTQSRSFNHQHISLSACFCVVCALDAFVVIR